MPLSPGLQVDDQIEKVLTRLEPARNSLRELTNGESDVRITLHVGRHFAEEEGLEEVGHVVGEDETILRQGVRLFGWNLSRPVLEFLVYVRAYLDVDEYDCAQMEANFDWPDSLDGDNEGPPASDPA